MGLLGSLIAKGVTTAAKNSTIRAVGNATATVIATKQSNSKEDAVVKNGKTYLKPTRSSDDYLDENALDITRELLGAGFESVVLKPVKKLSERAKKKYGKITSIKINGNDYFLGVKRVPASRL